MPAQRQVGAGEKSREEAVRAYQAGNKAAFAKVFDAYYPTVAGVLFKMLGNTPDMEDLVQTVFLEIHRCIHRFRWESRFSTWVYRLTINVAQQHLRREKYRRPADTGDREPWLQIVDPKEPEQSVINRETFDKIRQLLDEMPEKRRIVFILSDIQGLKADQIAQVLGIPKKKVYSRLFQARRIFHGMVKNDPYFMNKYLNSGKGESGD